MAEYSEYDIVVTYERYVGGSRQFAEADAQLTVLAKSEEQARGRAKQHVAAVVGADRVHTTTVSSKR